MTVWRKGVHYVHCVHYVHYVHCVHCVHYVQTVVQLNEFYHETLI